MNNLCSLFNSNPHFRIRFGFGMVRQDDDMSKSVECFPLGDLVVHNPRFEGKWEREFAKEMRVVDKQLLEKEL